MAFSPSTVLTRFKYFKFARVVHKKSSIPSLCKSERASHRRYYVLRIFEVSFPRL